MYDISVENYQKPIYRHFWICLQSYRYRKSEILKSSKNYRYRKMHQILADNLTVSPANFFCFFSTNCDKKDLLLPLTKQIYSESILIFLYRNNDFALFLRIFLLQNNISWKESELWLPFLTFWYYRKKSLKANISTFFWLSAKVSIRQMTSSNYQWFEGIMGKIIDIENI